MPKKSDKSMLKEAMQRVETGIYRPVDVSVFTDTELAEAFNSMVEGIASRNNRHLMRINEAMRMIGDGGWLKSMFDVINLQQEYVNRLQELDRIFSNNLMESDKSEVRTLTLIRQLRSSILPCIEGINEIVNAFAAEGGYQSLTSESVEKYHRLLQFNARTLMVMLDQADSAIEDVKQIYYLSAKENEMSKPMVEEVKNLTESCTRMSLECFNAGHKMYEISRMVDDERNDMFRYNSAPNVHESLKIFRVDHLVLTWRLFNHIQEYEVLRRDQVDNPSGCKLGTWIREIAPEWVREMPEFTAVIEAHNKLHDSAIGCYDAKEKYDLEAAKQYFEEALKDLETMIHAIDKLDFLFKTREEQEL